MDVMTIGYGGWCAEVLGGKPVGCLDCWRTLLETGASARVGTCQPVGGGSRRRPGAQAGRQAPVLPSSPNVSRYLTELPYRYRDTIGYVDTAYGIGEVSRK